MWVYSTANCLVLLGASRTTSRNVLAKKALHTATLRQTEHLVIGERVGENTFLQKTQLVNLRLPASACEGKSNKDFPLENSGS